MFKKILGSVRVKLFLTLCVVIFMIIAFFIIINNSVLEALYYYSKKEATLESYNYINDNIPKVLNNDENNYNYELELEKISVNNNFEILILNGEEEVYKTNKNYLQDFGTINEIKYEVKYSIFNKSDIVYSEDGINIRRIKDKKTGVNYILLKGKLKNENKRADKKKFKKISGNGCK